MLLALLFQDVVHLDVYCALPAGKGVHAQGEGRTQPAVRRHPIDECDTAIPVEELSIHLHCQRADSLRRLLLEGRVERGLWSADWCVRAAQSISF